MKNIIYGVLSLIFIFNLSGCSTKIVEPIDKKYELSHVCIEDNPKVIVTDFIPVVEDTFQSHGISTEVYYRNSIPADCSITMTYTALRRWDLSPYLSHAELRLYKKKKKIGYAEYHLTGGGGLDLSKWASVKSKMTPVIEDLLRQYPIIQ